MTAVVEAIAPPGRGPDVVMTTTHTDGHQGKLPDAASVYYPWFDWLRAILAITVMLGHDGLLPWARSGNFAVRVFFALSGWLIGGLLMNTPRQHLTRFYFNRAVRIWAPYYLALALLLSASLLRDPFVTQRWLEFVVYKLTFVYNLFGQVQLAEYAEAMPLRGTGNHFWSVNAEEQFYLLAPLLLVLAPPRFGRSPAVWVLLALATSVNSQYSTVIFGVAAAVIARSYPGIFNGRRMKTAIVVLALVLTTALVWGETGNVEGAYDAIAPLLSTCIVLSLAVRGPRQALGAVAGGMSYPLYLNHWIGGYVARALTTPMGLRDSFLTHFLSNGLNIALAVALYWYVDRQLLLHRTRFYTPRRGRIVTRIAYATMAVGLVFGVVLLVQRSP